MVNQWQLLALAKRADVDLFARDLPFYLPAWKARPGIFSELQEKILHDIKQPNDVKSLYDLTYRSQFPFDLDSSHKKTLVFGSSETKMVPRFFSKTGSVKQINEMDSVTIVTPSNWSAAGFELSGVDQDKICVVPHGIDPETFFPRPEVRDATRKSLGLSGFTFLSVGAMTLNKGMDLLVAAFAIVLDKYPEALLLLKGSDDLYASQAFLRDALNTLSSEKLNKVLSRLIYTGTTLSVERIALLYQAADVYVSPYRAEGFNLPVLEAMASGLPVICTGGGSTDDFVIDGCTKKIMAKRESFVIEDTPAECLVPNLDHLVHLMIGSIEDRDFRTKAKSMGPDHAAANFSWDEAVDKLLRLR